MIVNWTVIFCVLLAFTARLELVFWKHLARCVGLAACFAKGSGGDTLLAATSLLFLSFFYYLFIVTCDLGPTTGEGD